LKVISNVGQRPKPKERRRADGGLILRPDN